MRRLLWVLLGCAVFGFLLIVDTEALLHLAWIGLRAAPLWLWLAGFAVLAAIAVLSRWRQGRRARVKRRKKAKPRLRRPPA